MPKAQPKRITSVADLRPDDRNANRGTERGGNLIERSLRSYGAGRSVLVDRNGKIIAGNKTTAGAARAGVKKVRVVRTDGKRLVVVQRTDLDLDKDKAARELALIDNRTGELSLDWDAGNISALSEEFGIDLKDIGFSADELARLADKVVARGEQTAVSESFQVIVECRDEADQRDVYERLTGEGHRCRLLVL